MRTGFLPDALEEGGGTDKSAVLLLIEKTSAERCGFNHYDAVTFNVCALQKSRTWPYPPESAVIHELYPVNILVSADEFVIITVRPDAGSGKQQYSGKGKHTLFHFSKKKEGRPSPERPSD